MATEENTETKAKARSVDPGVLAFRNTARRMARQNDWVWTIDPDHNYLFYATEEDREAQAKPVKVLIREEFLEERKAKAEA